MTTPIDPIAVALTIARHLDALQIVYTVGGSIASSFAGEPRATIDIDIVADLHHGHVDALIAAISPDFYVDADALRRAIRDRTSANLVHRDTALKVDLFVAGGTPLDGAQLARRMAVDLGDQRRLYVHPPEDILLQKLRWYRLGGEVSDRQWRDMLAIVRVQGRRLDREYLRDGARILAVSDLLDRVLAQAADEG